MLLTCDDVLDIRAETAIICSQTGCLPREQGFGSLLSSLG